jgi:uncharacterized protein (DUF2252 family)
MPTTKNNPKKAVSDGGLATAPQPNFPSREERLAAGKALRKSVPRTSHAAWNPPAKRRNPIDVLEESNRDRLPQLVPIRYGRMLRSPFTFLRGSAGLMAYDLVTTPKTGIRVQVCGDCHLMNFGVFATPERNLIFDINDFDETLPAPWEWDVKRLAVSFAVAARDNGHSDKQARNAAVECVRAYREHLRDCSKKSPLEVWYERLDMQTLTEQAPTAAARKGRKKMAAKARKRIGEYMVPKIATAVGGRHRLVDQPPILFHAPRKEDEEIFREAVEDYRRSLRHSLRVLVERYRLEDFAAKVVGIGSVGTRCMVALFFSADGQPLLLQFKEAKRSVLEPYAGKSEFENQGERVVMGQRLMQSSSDIFLGWLRSRRGRDFFARQLRDMKMSWPVEEMTPQGLKEYAEICGLTLARAHATSGDAPTISGYLGNADTFDQAIGEFALAYADQTVRDHAALVAAVKARRIKAVVEKNL